MRRELICLLACAALALAGCSLAQPEKEDSGQDRFCGSYVVPYQRDETGQMVDGFYDSPYLETYGSETLDVEGIGAVEMERQVLFAETDEAGNVRFPGMEEGHSLLIYTYTDADGDPITTIQSDMGPGEEGARIEDTDAGSWMSASGTVYHGPPAGAPADWADRDDGTIWHFYRVWQAEDGRLYLDGSGNSYGGPNGSGWSASEEHTSKRTEDGETVEEETVSVSIAVQAVERLERLTVYQYGADDALLRADDIPLTEELPTLRCAAGTAWVVVEEVRSGGAVHTAYDLGDEAVSHGVVLLDEDGWGTYTALEIAR